MTVIMWFLLLIGLVVGFFAGLVLGDYYGCQDGKREAREKFMRNLHQRN